VPASTRRKANSKKCRVVQRGTSQFGVLIGRYPVGELEVDSGFVSTPPPIRRACLVLCWSGGRSSRCRTPSTSGISHLEASKLALLPSITLTADGGGLTIALLSLLNLNPLYFTVHSKSTSPSIKVVLARPHQDLSAQQERALAAYGSAALSAFREVEITLNNEGVLGSAWRISRQRRKDRKEASGLAESSTEPVSSTCCR